MKQWTLTALNHELSNDLQACNNQLERDCCKALALKEMRELWASIRATRKPTPGEVAVAELHSL